MNSNSYISILALSTLLCLSVIPLFSQNPDKNTGIDEKVKKFLESRKYDWRDLNVPESDGKILYGLIVEHKYKNALEIGTSTGHSGIWIAWGLSKTGGTLTTIEIDERRHNEALENFKEAGVSGLIDARLADAHELVPELEGKFDFVFIDADKDWYINYAKAVIPKLTVGGCIAAHNISDRRGSRSLTGNFLNYMKSLPDMETSVLHESIAGISVSYKKK